MNKVIQFLCLISLFGGTAQAMDASKEDLNAQLIDAAKDGNLSRVMELIEAGADVDARDIEGDTPLLKAASKSSLNESKYLEVCKYLVANKADVNAQNNTGWTPLLSASCNSSKTVSIFLIANKADVNARAYFGRTPLMHAATNNHFKHVYESLITNGANIYARNDNNETPLLFAAIWKRKETCQYLVDIMLKPNKNTATILLGIKRHRQAPSLHMIDKHVVQVIAQQTLHAQRQVLFEQINAISNPDMKKFLLDYARQKIAETETDRHTNQGN